MQINPIGLPEEIGYVQRARSAPLLAKTWLGIVTMGKQYMIS